MGNLDQEAAALARRSGQECAALRELINSASARLDALEAAGGGGGVWGTITGTLSDQTDLQAALDAISSSGVPDGDKGDVTVSSGGTAWTVPGLAGKGNLTGGNSWVGTQVFGTIRADQVDLNNLGTGSFLTALYYNGTLTANRTLGIDLGDASRTLTLTGNATVSGTNTGDQDISGKANLVGGNTWTGTQVFGTTQVDQLDLINLGSGAFRGSIYYNGTLSANRSLGIDLGNANRTLTFTGNATISGTNTGDQDLSSYATTAAVAAGYQPLDAALTALAAGSNFVQFTGPTSSTKVKTVRDASDTILELGGSYTPTGTWTNLPLATPTIGGAATLSENASIHLDSTLSADGKWTGLTMAGVSGYSQAFGDLVQLDPTSGRWEAVDVSVAAAAVGDARALLGMVAVAGTDGNACTVLIQGTLRADANFPALTVGAACYATTAGDITLTQPTTTDHVIRIIGHAVDANTIFFNPGPFWTTHT